MMAGSVASPGRSGNHLIRVDTGEMWPRRGSPVSTQVPKTAADRPSITMAIKNTMPTDVRLASKWLTRLVL
jgi:hypothetical protein